MRHLVFFFLLPVNSSHTYLHLAARHNHSVTIFNTEFNLSFFTLKKDGNPSNTTVVDNPDDIVKTQHKHEEAIAQNARNIAELSRRLSDELVNLRNRQMANRHAFASLQKRIATATETSTAAPVPASTFKTADCRDDCEIRLSGLPVKLDPCDITNVKHVLEALEEERLLSRVIRVQEWKTKPRVSAANSAISQIDTAAKHVPDTQACVLRFASANARESFLATAPRFQFQRLAVSKIFVLHETEDSRLSNAPILIPDRY
uniref:Uncharacterized protein n=1 Tax=Trichogramma kaykai TaxID=54128 RepID=A0ABD2WZZ2_9HYME